MKRLKSCLILAVAVFIILIAGCAKNSPNTEGVPQAVKNLEKFKLVTVEHPNTAAPAFILTDDKGINFSSNDLKGKIYIIQGFAPGCSSCAREIATLNKLYDKFHGKGLEIISLDIVSDDPSGVLYTKKQFNGGNWHWTFDSDNLAVKLEMKTLESTYLVDKEGIIRYKDETITNADVLSDEIQKLI